MSERRSKFEYEELLACGRGELDLARRQQYLHWHQQVHKCRKEKVTIEIRKLLHLNAIQNAKGIISEISSQKALFILPFQLSLPKSVVQVLYVCMQS